MSKAKGFLLAVAVAAMAFTVSCTSDIETAEEFLAKQSSSSEGNSSSSSRQNSSSSSALPSSSSQALSINFLEDSRDRQTYKTVLIGTQTWFAKNLNYDATGSKCYSNQESNCAKYGRLYDWETAKTACPSGWHLPSEAEWNTLSSYVQSNSGCSSCDARLLKATSGWNIDGNGTDKYGFSALPGGYGYSDGSFDLAGYGGYWWSASEYNSNYAYGRIMYYDDEDAYWDDYRAKSYLFSVRCLQD